MFLFLSTAAFSQVDSTLKADLEAILDTKINIYNLKGVEATIILANDGRWTGVSGITHPSSTPQTPSESGIGEVLAKQ